MKTIKNILAMLTVSALALPSLASYVFQWQLEGDWQSYDYAVIAAYDNINREGAAVGYLYNANNASAASSDAPLADLANASFAEKGGLGVADVTYLSANSGYYYPCLQLYVLYV